MSLRSPRLWALLTCAASLGLSACIPDLGLMPTEKPPAAYATEKSFSAPQADWPSADWWMAYGDDQLNALVAEGLASAPDLKIAEARLRQADATAQQSDCQSVAHAHWQGQRLGNPRQPQSGLPAAVSVLPAAWLA